MKSISSSSLFQLPRVCGGGRNSGGDARLYRYCGGSSSSSSTIVAKKSKNKRPPPPKDSKPPPPRITSNLKQNLQILRYLKEHQKRKSTTPRPSTSYRRKKVVKEDLPEETELSDDPTTFDLDEDIEGAAPVLLVDGYNVCGYWPKLRKDFMSGRLDIARQNLIDELVTYSGMTDMKVVVVFDAYMSGLRTHKENFFGIDVVYSAETSADAWIEEEVALLRKDGCTEVWVATSDSLEQEIAFDEVERKEKGKKDQFTMAVGISSQDLQIS